MVVSATINGDTEKIKKMSVNVGFAVELLLQKISQNVQNYAKENAPVGEYKNGRQGGTLRRSINHDRDKVKQGTAIVGSPVAYSRRREYENNLHPWTKYYLKRGYTEHEGEYREIIKNALTEKLK